MTEWIRPHKNTDSMTSSKRPEIHAHRLLGVGLAGILILGAGCATDATRAVDAPVDSERPVDRSSLHPSEDDFSQAFEDPFFDDPFSNPEQADAYDPWESYNSSMFGFNQKMDRYVFKPIAKGYDWIMPDRVEHAISRAFHNLGFAPRLLNNVLQGKMKGAGTESARFLLNSTFGIAGLFDVAGSWFDLEPSEEDTGQTLAVYGVGPGPYLVLPLLPPLTVRDGVGFMTNFALNPLFYIAPSTALIGLNAGRTVNERSRLLDGFETFDQASLDLYTATRDVYFQKRRQAVLE